MRSGFNTCRTVARRSGRAHSRGAKARRPEVQGCQTNQLQPSGDDIAGGNAVTPEEPAPGATGTLTATLSPTAAAGTAVNGIVSVVDSTDPGAGDPIGFPASSSDFHDFGYAYTVGS